MVLELLRKQKSPKEDAAERRRIAAILDAALLQRSKIYIRFDAAASTLTGVTGLILSMESGVLILELDGVSALTSKFIGQHIGCFFRIVEKEDRHREIFYSFTVKISHIRQSKNQTVLIAVAIPDTIEGTQRRKSLRLKPDLKNFSHLAFWKYDASGGFDIHKPTVSYCHFKSMHALLENVSAGGMRLLLRRPVIKEQNLSPQKGDRFIVFFTFAAAASRLRNEYWLVAKTNNVRLDPVSGDVTLGLEFIANGTRQPDTSKIAWGKVDDNVIEDLAQRIYEWHLALYREKGLT